MSFLGGLMGGGDSGGGLGGLLGGALGMFQGSGNQSQSRQLDPFGPSRSMYVDQLNQLMNNPSSVTSLPGYQFGLDQGEQALTRNLASQGLTGSGTAAAAIPEFAGEYASNAFQRQLQNLMSLSGANFGEAGAMGAAQMRTAGQNTFNQGLQQFLPALQGLFGGSGGGGLGDLGSLFSGAGDWLSGIFGGAMDWFGSAGAADAMGSMAAFA